MLAKMPFPVNKFATAANYLVSTLHQTPVRHIITGYLGLSALLSDSR